MIHAHFADFLPQISYSPADLAVDKRIREDTKSLKDALSKKDFSKIIHDAGLFWLAFCKEASRLEGERSDCFSVVLSIDSLTISGKEHIIPKIQKTVDEIRKIFVKGLQEKRAFTIVPVKICTDRYIREKSELIDLRDWLSERNVKIFENWYTSFIKPCMQGLSTALGAKSSVGRVSQKIIDDDIFGIQTKEQESLHVEWMSGEYFVYPIAARVVPNRGNLSESAYSMYERQILCDMTLVASDGVVKVHSVPIFTYGGEVVQAILTSNMKEAKEKTILFKEFSLNTLKVFIRFTYLGEAGLPPEFIRENEINLFELLAFAHTYQVKELLDCCTNLISLFVTAQDADNIKNLANVYENKHLMELYNYLSCPTNPCS